MLLDKQLGIDSLYLLLNSKNSRYSDLLKYTFLDLVANGIIHVEKSPFKEKIGVQLYYISAGPNYGKSAPKEHQIIFLMPFLQNRSLRILLRQYTKIIGQKSPSEKNYKKQIVQADTGDYFKNNNFLLAFNRVSLTEKGKEMKKSIKAYFSNLKTTWVSGKHKDNEAYFIELVKLERYLILLDFFGDNLLEQLRSNYSTFDTEGWFIVGDTFHWFNDDYSFMDDASFYDDSSDWSFDSGCSSYDSGCSSCSGCGGCGGCGGCS